MSNSLDQDQAQHFLIWVQTVCKGYHQTTKDATSGERVKSAKKKKEKKKTYNLCIPNTSDQKTVLTKQNNNNKKENKKKNLGYFVIQRVPRED